MVLVQNQLPYYLPTQADRTADDDGTLVWAEGQVVAVEGAGTTQPFSVTHHAVGHPVRGATL